MSELQEYVNRLTRLFAEDERVDVPGKVVEALGNLLRQSDMVEDVSSGSKDGVVDPSVSPSNQVEGIINDQASSELPAPSLSDNSDSVAVEKPWRKSVSQSPGDSSKLSRDGNAVEWLLETNDEKESSSPQPIGAELSDQDRRILKSRIQQLKYNYDMLLKH